MTPNEAVAHLHQWQHAVNLQCLRLLNEGTGMPEGPTSREVDAYLFAIALRNLLRAVDLVRSLVPGKEQSNVDSAIAAFNHAIPNAVNVRHVLEHFDAYAVGKGNLQKTVSPGVPAAIWHERDGSTHVLWVGIRGRPPFRLDVRQAATAAAHLASEAISAAHPPAPSA